MQLRFAQTAVFKIAAQAGDCEQFRLRVRTVQYPEYMHAGHVPLC